MFGEITTQIRWRQTLFSSKINRKKLKWSLWPNVQIGFGLVQGNWRRHLWGTGHVPPFISNHEWFEMLRGAPARPQCPTAGNANYPTNPNPIWTFGEKLGAWYRCRWRMVERTPQQRWRRPSWSRSTAVDYVTSRPLGTSIHHTTRT